MLTTSNGIPVSVRKNRLARHIKLSITSKREIKITLPWYAPLAAARAIIREKEIWIEKTLADLPQYPNYSAQKIKHFKQKTFELVSALAEKYAPLYGVHFQNIRIGNQATRWGSCSSSGTLSFNWRLALVPENICRYVVIHELCHFREMNHSPRFWLLVAEQCPDYKAERSWLRKNAKHLL